MADDRILATYLIETPTRGSGHREDAQLDDHRHLHTGAWRDRRDPGALRGEVVRIVPLPPVDRPGLPAWNYRTRQAPTTFHRAEAVLSLPLALTETDLTCLMATLWGGVYGMSELSGIRLLDLKLPPPSRRPSRPPIRCPGHSPPDGRLRPPDHRVDHQTNVGLTPEQTAGIVEELVAAGVDFIKDDEKLTSPVYSTTEERVRAVMAVTQEHAQRTGKQVMYPSTSAAMIRRDGAPPRYCRRCRRTAVMVSIAQVGIGALQFLRRRCCLPIHGHRNGWELLTRSPTVALTFAPGTNCIGLRAWIRSTSTASATSSGSPMNRWCGRLRRV